MTNGNSRSSGPALRSHVVHDRACERPAEATRLAIAFTANLRELGYGE